MSKLASPFLNKGRLNTVLLVAFLVINGLVLVNAVLHDPTVEYDASDHLAIIKYVASNAEWPTAKQTNEFFSPPLPYLLPAFVLRMHLFDANGAFKFAQLINVGLSFFLTFFLLKICDRLDANNAWLKFMALALLGILPVYYRTFAFVRGEPYVATFAVLSTYQALHLFSAQKKLVPALILGVELGLLILSRQWGFFLFPAIGIIAALLDWKERHFVFIGWTMVSFFIAFVVGGWFYLLLLRQYGTASAFNKTPAASFSFSNQPLTFYIGMGDGLLFRDPIRPAFVNQFFPIFYADTWGDYWMYFTVYGRDKRNGELLSGVSLLNAAQTNPLPSWLETNYLSIGNYLGRLNLLALLPSLLLLAGFVFGLVSMFRLRGSCLQSESEAAQALLSLIVLLSFLGYAWFLIRYPALDTGNTIKASYLIQVFPLIAVLGAYLLKRMGERWYYLECAASVVLVLIFVFNFPAFITHFIGQ
jgi:4-amino-4-deoxy-L-arabinose transferase-like glycosyltransferase